MPTVSSSISSSSSSSSSGSNKHSSTTVPFLLRFEVGLIKTDLTFRCVAFRNNSASCFQEYRMGDVEQPSTGGYRGVPHAKKSCVMIWLNLVATPERTGLPSRCCSTDAGLLWSLVEVVVEEDFFVVVVMHKGGDWGPAERLWIVWLTAVEGEDSKEELEAPSLHSRGVEAVELDVEDTEGWLVLQVELIVFLVTSMLGLCWANSSRYAFRVKMKALTMTPSPCGMRDGNANTVAHDSQLKHS